ncbi:unnamed protein product [Oppiella nova]|uniref:Methyltransferase type 11 domain-containing protein n=1 Tax=Oppiella nova TaxID=334625 RepID=A0A7R9QEY7_9ACAR|nr:unnamed protein product [Oppiella nova]CAG2164561.1 unnamed protein product [Oppiella nova]
MVRPDLHQLSPFALFPNPNSIGDGIIYETRAQLPVEHNHNHNQQSFYNSIGQSNTISIPIETNGLETQQELQRPNTDDSEHSKGSGIVFDQKYYCEDNDKLLNGDEEEEDVDREEEAIISRTAASVNACDSLNLSNCLETHKRQLFSSLNAMISHDKRLANEGVGCLRVLEIGIGSGNNLKYYPRNTRLITIEPNPHFRTKFDAKLKDFPSIILEKAVTGTAEDMSTIEDNCVDVVVSTHVLCSVYDIQQCLKEIRRVLAPDGKFIYVEHVSYELGSLEHRFQSWIEYFWRLVNDDCRITLQTSRYIRDANFSSVDEKSVLVKELFITLIRPHIFGIASK